MKEGIKLKNRTRERERNKKKHFTATALENIYLKTKERKESVDKWRVSGAPISCACDSVPSLCVKYIYTHVKLEAEEREREKER